jgi:hypothetical protein
MFAGQRTFSCLTRFFSAQIAFLFAVGLHAGLILSLLPFTRQLQNAVNAAPELRQESFSIAGRQMIQRECHQ